MNIQVLYRRTYKSYSGTEKSQIQWFWENNCAQQTVHDGHFRLRHQEMCEEGQLLIRVCQTDFGYHESITDISPVSLEILQPGGSVRDHFPPTNAVRISPPAQTQPPWHLWEQSGDRNAFKETVKDLLCSFPTCTPPLRQLDGRSATSYLRPPGVSSPLQV